MKTLILLWVLGITLILSTLYAHADSTPFVTQSNGTVDVSLAGSPTVGPSYGLSPYLGGCYLQFGSILPQGSGTMSLTIDGITQTVGLTSDGSSIIQGFHIPRNIYTPTLFTLTIVMNGVTSTYTGYDVNPVPEMSTWILFLFGLGCIIGWKKYVRA